MRGSFSNVGGSRASAAARKGQKVGSVALGIRARVRAAFMAVLRAGDRARAAGPSLSVDDGWLS